MPAPAGYRAYDTRCREARDIGLGYYAHCEERTSSGSHTHYAKVGKLSLTWSDPTHCPAKDPKGWRCQLVEGHGTYHRALTREGDVHNFGTKAEDYVARIASDNLAALASNTIVGPCMDSRMLSPGYAIQCVLSKNHGHPHMVRFGSIVTTWGYETQCPALHHSYLRCLNGNGHEGAHMTIHTANNEALHWVGGTVSEETYRAIQEQQTLLDPEYLAVLKQRGLEQSANRPRTYAERKRGRR